MQCLGVDAMLDICNVQVLMHCSFVNVFLGVDAMCGTSCIV